MRLLQELRPRRCRGWQRNTQEDPLGSDLSGQVHRLAWVLHGIPFSVDLLNATAAEHPTTYREVWAGATDSHRFVVANAWTDIGPHALRFYDYQALAVCAVERCRLVPFWVQPRHLSRLDRYTTPSPTGDPAFDDRFSAALPLPGTGPVLLNAEVRRRRWARDNWAFVSTPDSLLCAPAPARTTPLTR